MGSNLDMSLDDIIRKSKEASAALRRRSTRPLLTPPTNNRAAASGPLAGPARGWGGHGPGPDRRFSTRGPNRLNPYPVPPMPMTAPLPEPVIIGGDSAGTKLYVSNLDYGVSNEDIKLLFSEVGDLNRYSIHYDKSGRSKGTAEVVFINPVDAVAAIKRYNNVNLDGKPMKIELVGVNLVAPVTMPIPAPNSLGNPFRSLKEKIGSRGRGQGRSGNSHHGGARGQGQGRRSRSGQKPSAEDLDAELEKYHLEAMQIN